MKKIIALIIMTSLLYSCHTNVSKRNGQIVKEEKQSTVNVDNNVSLGLNKAYFSPGDTITINITNKSNDEILLSLRCGTYLEMSYEEMQDGNWSGKKEPWYMNLKCLTKMETLGAGKSYSFSLPAGKVGDSGIFRFYVAYSISGENRGVNSVVFRIEGS